MLLLTIHRSLELYIHRDHLLNRLLSLSLSLCNYWVLGADAAYYESRGVDIIHP
jgi:hypothetical protein